MSIAWGEIPKKLQQLAQKLTNTILEKEEQDQKDDFHIQLI